MSYLVGGFYRFCAPYKSRGFVLVPENRVMWMELLFREVPKYSHAVRHHNCSEEISVRQIP